MAKFLAAFWDYVETLVHHEARRSDLARARHRAFIGPRLVGGAAALACLPIYLSLRGAPTVLDVTIFAWFAVPVALAFLLSRTGLFEGIHALSAVAMAALVGLIALQTGGASSLVLIWLLLVPLEAVVSGSRRVILCALGATLVVLGLVTLADYAGWASAPLPVTPMAMVVQGILPALGYATGMAFGLRSHAETGFDLFGREARRARLFDDHAQDVMTRHARGGAVLAVSGNARAQWRLDPATLAGQGLFERVHVADRPAYLSALSLAGLEGREERAEFRLRCGARADGRLGEPFVWVEMVCRRLAAAQTISGEDEVVAVLRDVSARKMQEQALADARSDAGAAQAAKMRFLATMSHELRTPLNAIIGFSDMLMRGEELGFDAARRKDYAQLINGSGYHLLEVVNGILDMSKIENGAFDVRSEAVALAPLVAQCCDTMALKAREGRLTLVYRCDPALPAVLADPRALRQILFNLVSNAIKFTEAGGSVKVEATLDGTHCRIRVCDTGIGIAEADLPRLGDAFYQASANYDRRREGTGLGLSIVKGLVALQDGEFAIESRLGQGTTVSITLPIASEAARVAPIRRAARAAIEQASASVSSVSSQNGVRKSA